MAKLFQITSPGGISTLKLDSRGSASLQYTVKNVSSRTIDGRAVLTSIPQTKPPSGAVEKGWVKVDGQPERHFDIDKEETFTVKVAVPPKSPAGSYSFRLDMVSVAKPDEGDEGQAVGFTVAAATPAKPVPILAWLIPLIVVVLIAGGVGLWLALKPSGIKVPDLTGEAIPDATSALTAVKLTLDPKIDTAQSKPEDSDKIISQNPAAGATAKAGDSVHVTVGAEMTSVPDVTLHPLSQAEAMLTGSHLSVGQVTNQANPGVTGGTVWRQSPEKGNSVLTNSEVALWVAPQTVAVPPVTGLLVGTAVQRLQQAGLQLGTLNGDLVTQPVTAQSPAASAQVALGTKVDLTVPRSQFCVPITRCIFGGTTARLMANPSRITAKPR
jgi:beta-lactam-binding protein with PASTA domain